MASDGAMMSPTPSQEQPRQRVGALGLAIILAFFVLAPSALRYSYNLSSFAPGVVGVAVAIWGLALLGVSILRRGKGASSIFLLSCSPAA